MASLPRAMCNNRAPAPLLQDGPAAMGDAWRAERRHPSLGRSIHFRPFSFPSRAFSISTRPHGPARPTSPSAPRSIRPRPLDAFLPAPPFPPKPATIHKAMRYSLFRPAAKRLRPVLTLAAAESLWRRGSRRPRPPACRQVELHPHLLAHPTTTLPCMDDRRPSARGTAPDPLRHPRFFGERAVGRARGRRACLTIAFENPRASLRPRPPLLHCRAHPRTRQRQRQPVAHRRPGRRPSRGEGKKNSAGRGFAIHPPAARPPHFLTASIRLGAMSANTTPRAPRRAHPNSARRSASPSRSSTTSSMSLRPTEKTRPRPPAKTWAATKATYPRHLRPSTRSPPRSPTGSPAAAPHRAHTFSAKNAATLRASSRTICSHGIIEISFRPVIGCNCLRIRGATWPVATSARACRATATMGFFQQPRQGRGMPVADD